MTEPHRTTRRSKLWWWVGGLAAAVVVGLLVAGAIYVRGRGIWTDGMDLTVARDRAQSRDVLWLPPEPMAEQVNTPGEEYEVCLSSDGSEMYFVRGLPGKGADLYVSVRREGQWSTPEPVASVNTPHDELGPRLSPDARTLLFYSDRPGGLGGYDLWAAARTDEGWGPAVNLGPAVNGPHNEYGPALDVEGRRLFFATNRKAAERAGGALKWKATIRQGEIGDYDLFVAACRESTTEAKRPAPATRPSGRPTTRPARGGAPLVCDQAVEVPGVNTPSHEGAPCVSPAGDFLYFASNRPGGSGGFDLYRVRITAADWPGPENLGPEVNTDANETDPQLADAGFTMYFSSDRDAGRGNYDLYRTASREVYTDRTGRDLPELGWSVWVFLGAVALLVPLLLFLKAGGYRHLSTIQKCAVVSLLLHVLLTLMFSLHELSRQIVRHVKEADMEVALNLDLSRRVEVVSEIRDQVSDLPVAEAKQAAVKRSQIDLPPLETVSLPPAQMPTGAAPPRSGVMEIVVPRRKDRPKTTEAVEPPTPTPMPVAPVLNMDFARAPVARDEAMPDVAPPEGETPAPRRADVPDRVAKATAPRAEEVAPVRPVHSTAEMTVVERPVERLVPRDPPPKTDLVDVQPKPAAPADVRTVRIDRGERVVSMSPDPPPAPFRRPTTMPAAKAKTVALDAPPAPSAPARSIAGSEPLVRDAAEPDAAEPDAEVSPPDMEMLASAPTFAAPKLSPGPVRAEAVSDDVSPPRPGTVSRRAVPESVRAPAGQITPKPLRTKAVSSSSVTPLGGTERPASPAAEEIALGAPRDPSPPKIRLPQADQPVRATDEPAPPDSAAETGKAVITPRTPARPDPAGARKAVRLAMLTDRPDGPTSLIGLKDSLRPARAAERPGAADISDLAPPIAPEDLAPGVLVSPEKLSHRSPLERTRLVKTMGGTEKSERAVERALRYLADTQQGNGRWTTVTDRHTRRVRKAGQSDIALTGLAVLCNLAAGYTPATANDYQKTVGRGLNYLMARQRSDGSLWEGGGRMYGHAIATLALAEAAAMTSDPTYRKAAFKGSEYILRAQHRSGGGWRYAPGERGDTSVVGWCVMALHSTERLGMKIPRKTRDGAFRYLHRVGGGRTRVLAGYQSRSPSPAMSAEAAFSRMLLGQELTDAQQNELGTYLIREGRQRDNYYCWYYTSLALFQMGGKPWEKWNPKIRDYLITLQRRGGSDEGSWPANGKYAGHNGGGKIYTTAMATLTLEVYYRYLPILGGRKGRVGKP